MTEIQLTKYSTVQSMGFKRKSIKKKISLPGEAKNFT